MVNEENETKNISHTMKYLRISYKKKSKYHSRQITIPTCKNFHPESFFIKKKKKPKPNIDSVILSESKFKPNKK